MLECAGLLMIFSSAPILPHPVGIPWPATVWSTHSNTLFPSLHPPCRDLCQLQCQTPTRPFPPITSAATPFPVFLGFSIRGLNCNPHSPRFSKCCPPHLPQVLGLGHIQGATSYLPPWNRGHLQPARGWGLGGGGQTQVQYWAYPLLIPVSPISHYLTPTNPSPSPSASSGSLIHERHSTHPFIDGST